jgi:hypothetical protein
VSSNPENEDSSSQSRNAPPENSKTNEVTTHKEFLKLPFGERLEVVTE